MSAPYHIRLSDGTTVDIDDSSAGNAMAKALKQNPGKVIRACYSGNKEPLQSRTDKGVITMPPAWVDYEVPEHSAYIEPVAKMKPPPVNGIWIYGRHASQRAA